MVYLYISSFNANPITFLRILKFYLLNMNVSLQFADTTIVNLYMHLVCGYAGLQAS